MLISHWWRLRFLLAVWACNRTVNSFPKWYDTWKSAQKWGHESQFFNLVIFSTNTKKFKNPWLGAPGIFFGLFQWCQGIFLKVPEGFQRKKISSWTETLLLPKINFDFNQPLRTLRCCKASHKSSSGSRTWADPGPGTWSASPRSSSTPGPIRGEHGVSTNHSSPGPGRRWAGAAASWALSWAGRAAAARGTVCLCSRGTRAACAPPPPGLPGWTTAATLHSEYGIFGILKFHMHVVPMFSSMK